MVERFAISYSLTCAANESAEEKARGIALEQTVELPAECVAPEVLETAAGRLEELVAIDDGSGRWRARISFPVESAGRELPQLANLLFGNISMQRGIRLEEVDWPEALLAELPGPVHGIEGVRNLCRAEPTRPLLGVTLKPLGVSSGELARLCRELTLAGVDVVKDDHSLADQSWAPFDERVPLCQKAVDEANRETGGSTRYFPNLTGGLGDMRGRLDRARRAGCRGAVVSPAILGFELTRSIAESSGLALLGHPAFTGVHFDPRHGIAPGVLLGEIFRLIGCDAVIYPNVGGRLSLSAEDCDEIHRRLRAPLGSMRPALPVAAGGIDVSRVAEWTERYGPDTMFLIGTSLYREPDLQAAAAALMLSLRAASVA